MTVRIDYTFLNIDLAYLNTHTHTGYSKIDLAYLNTHTEYSKLGMDLSRRF